MKREELSGTIPKPETIICIEKYNCYTIITLKEKRQEVFEFSLEKFEEDLPPQVFFRVHKSFIINLNEIVEIVQNGNTHNVILSNGKCIPISKRRKCLLHSKLHFESTLI